MLTLEQAINNLPIEATISYWKSDCNGLVEVEVEFCEDVGNMDAYATDLADDLFGEDNWVFKDGCLTQDYTTYINGITTTFRPRGYSFGRIVIMRKYAFAF